jgi:hypothetical protein
MRSPVKRYSGPYDWTFTTRPDGRTIGMNGAAFFPHPASRPIRSAGRILARIVGTLA